MTMGYSPLLFLYRLSRLNNREQFPTLLQDRDVCFFICLKLKLNKYWTSRGVETYLTAPSAIVLQNYKIIVNQPNKCSKKIYKDMIKLEPFGFIIRRSRDRDPLPLHWKLSTYEKSQVLFSFYTTDRFCANQQWKEEKKIKNSMFFVIFYRNVSFLRNYH